MNRESKPLAIVHLEPIPTRYTYYWKEHLPTKFADAGFEVSNYVGSRYGKATDGAFLNFADTNVYKSQQAVNLLDSINNGYLDNGVILFTDA